MRQPLLFAIWRVVLLTPEVIWIEDTKLGGRTITNDAEFVVREVLSAFGPHTVYYRDTMGAWAQLCHDGGRFTGFGPGRAPPSALVV